MMKKIFYLMLVVVFASSCATGYYAPHNVNQFGTQTQVVLSEANFRIVRHLEVVIDINNTNLKRADVEKSAYAELVRRADLTGSQALINVVIEEVRRDKLYVLLTLFSGVRVSKITQHVAARGTIIEFLDKNGNPIQSVAPQGTAPRAAAQTSDSDSKVIDANTSYQGSAPRSNQADTKQASEANEGTFAPVVINLQWGASTKSIAKTYNNSHQVDAIYDFNEDGKLSEEELEYINYILCDSKKAPNKQKFFEMAHKDYVNTVGRIKKK